VSNAKYDKSLGNLDGQTLKGRARSDILSALDRGRRPDDPDSLVNKTERWVDGLFTKPSTKDKSSESPAEESDSKSLQTITSKELLANNLKFHGD